MLTRQSAFATCLAGLLSVSGAAHAQVFEVDSALSGEDGTFRSDFGLQDNRQVDTINDGISLSISQTSLSALSQQSIAAEGVLFVPLDSETPGRLWNVEIQADKTTRLALSSTRLIADDNGRINEIETLDSVTIDSDAPPTTIALPSAAEYLEFATSTPVTVTLTPVETIGVSDPVLDTPFGVQLAQRVAIPVSYDLAGARENLTVEIDLPANVSAELWMRVDGSWIDHPVNNGTALAAAKAASELRLDLQRPSAFRDDPWPIVEMNLGIAPITVDEIEPNQNKDSASPIIWASDDRRITQRGQISYGAEADFWRFSHDSDRAVEITLDPGANPAVMTLRTADGEVLTSVSGTGELTLAPLVLPPDDYMIEITTSTEAFIDYDLKLRRIRQPDADSEAEPNDTLTRAQRLLVGQTIDGTVQQGDTDTYVFDILQEGRMWSLLTPGSFELELLANNGTRITRGEEETTTGISRIPPTPLPIGSYAVTLTGDAGYDLTLRDLGPVPDDWEVEPNNSIYEAYRISIGDTTRGQLGAGTGNSDIVYFTVPSDQNVGFRIAAPDDSVMDIDLYYRDTATYSAISLAAGDSIDQVFWMEQGEYAFVLDGWRTPEISRDSWSLELYTPAPDAVFEKEPNSDQFTRVMPGERVIGENFGLDAWDGYLFALPSDQGQAIYDCTTSLQWTSFGIGDVGMLGADLEADPGTERFHSGALFDHDGSENKALAILQTDRADRGYDCAAHWISDTTVTSAMAGMSDVLIPWAQGYSSGGFRNISAPMALSLDFNGQDQYHFVSIDAPQDAILSCTDSAVQVKLYDETGTSLTSGVRPADAPMTISLPSGKGFLELFNRTSEPVTNRCWVSMDGAEVAEPLLKLDIPQAFYPETLVDRGGIYSGIVLPGELGARYNARQPAFTVDVPGVNTVVSECEFRLATGEVRTERRAHTRFANSVVYEPARSEPIADFSCAFIPIADLPTLPLPGDGYPDNGSIEASNSLREGWTVPEQLAGGINVASARFGGRISAVADEPVADAGTYLIDDNAYFGGLHSVTNWNNGITFDLAGDAALPIAGIHYTMRPRGMSLTDPMRHVRVAASTDGTNFVDVGTYPLGIHGARQYVAFAGPVRATHIRIENPDCRVRFCMAMSEFGIIAAPGAVPEILSPEINLADPAYGGRLISATTDVGALTETHLFSPDVFRLFVEEDAASQPTDILIGFWRDRKAEVTRVEWVIPEDKELMNVTRFEVLAVDNILAAPTTLGEINAPAPGEVSALNLPEGTDLRYIILRADLPERRNEIAGFFRVIEAATRPNYRSILGTWDEDDAKGPSEWFAPAEPVELPEKVQSSEAAPAPLNSMEVTTSHTEKEGLADWYGIQATDTEQDEVWRVITLSAPNIVEVGARLIAPDGSEVELIPLPGLDRTNRRLAEAVAELDLQKPDGWQDNLTFLARVDPAQDYTLRIAEEARLLIMRRERTALLSTVDVNRRRAYIELAELLGDGIDAIDIGVPTVDGEMLIRGRDDIMLAMTRMPVAGQDSGIGTTDFGTAVAASAEVLRLWPGGKSIVYFGMGGGIMDVEDMDWVHKVQDVPVRTVSVFAPCDPGSFFCPDQTVAELNALTFAASTGGRFLRPTSKAELYDAIVSAATDLYGPKPYGVSWQDIPVLPEMAELSLSLSVEEQERAEAVPPGPPALGIILDASGSMLRRLDGERRIRIAQNALVDVIENTVPDGTEVSFRAFGLAVDACDTANLSPLAPLDRATLRDAITGVEAINLAKTPIADSLRAAATDDLAAATGPRAIILLTDGEETCDGDVAATLDALNAEGINITLSIVGFAIDDEALKADFENWATRGNGAYFDASNEAGLQDALGGALEAVEPEPIPTFASVTRIDGDRAEPFTLSFDDTILLDAGRYLLTLDTGKTLTMDVEAGENYTIDSAEFE